MKRHIKSRKLLSFKSHLATRRRLRVDEQSCKMAVKSYSNYAGSITPKVRVGVTDFIKDMIQRRKEIKARLIINPKIKL